MSFDSAKQSFLLSGVGPYSNPNDIYNPGHRIYNYDIIYSDKAGKLSGVLRNIDILNSDMEEVKVDNSNNFLITKNTLTEDITIPPEYSGYSTNLDFNSFNVTTTSNDFVNL